MNKTELDLEEWKELLPLKDFSDSKGKYGATSVINTLLKFPCLSKTCTKAVDSKCSVKFIPIDDNFRCKNDETISF